MWEVRLTRTIRAWATEAQAGEALAGLILRGPAGRALCAGTVLRFRPSLTEGQLGEAAAGVVGRVVDAAARPASLGWAFAAERGAARAERVAAAGAREVARRTRRCWARCRAIGAAAASQREHGDHDDDHRRRHRPGRQLLLLGAAAARRSHWLRPFAGRGGPERCSKLFIFAGLWHRVAAALVLGGTATVHEPDTAALRPRGVRGREAVDMRK